MRVRDEVEFWQHTHSHNRTSYAFTHTQHTSPFDERLQKHKTFTPSDAFFFFLMAQPFQKRIIPLCLFDLSIHAESLIFSRLIDGENKTSSKCAKKI